MTAHILCGISFPVSVLFNSSSSLFECYSTVAQIQALALSKSKTVWILRWIFLIFFQPKRFSTLKFYLLISSMTTTWKRSPFGYKQWGIQSNRLFQISISSERWWVILVYIYFLWVSFRCDTIVVLTRNNTRIKVSKLHWSFSSSLWLHNVLDCN